MNVFCPATTVAPSLANPHWSLCDPDIVHSMKNSDLLQFNYDVFQYTAQRGAHSDDFVIF